MQVGTTIGQYRLLRPLGSGGMGSVFLGEHALLGRPAAIKTLLPTLASIDEVVDRFFAEARATSAISDPGVVQIYDFGYHTDGTAYIVMEYLEGETLDARIERLVKLPAADALRIARQLAGSLEAAHQRGIIHRDLKPDNVFLVRDHEAQGGERPKILDFGIAKMDDDPTPRSRTRTGAMLGTPTYMSPEQCRGAGAVDARSDQYALGCLLFHALTGAPPFDADGVGDIIACHLREPAPAPSSMAPGLPDEVDDLVLRCLAKSPDDRFASMAELELAIEAVQARFTGRRAAADAPRDLRPRTVTPSSRRPTTIGTASGQRSIIDDEPHRRQPLGLWAAASIFIVGGVAAFLLASRLARADGDVTPSAAAAGHDAAVVIDAGPDPAPLPPIDAGLPIDAAMPPIDAAMPPIDAGPQPSRPAPPSKPRRERQPGASYRPPAEPRTAPASRPAPASRTDAPRGSEVQDLYDIR